MPLDRVKCVRAIEDELFIVLEDGPIGTFECGPHYVVHWFTCNVIFVCLPVREQANRKRIFQSSSKEFLSEQFFVRTR